MNFAPIFEKFVYFRHGIIYTLLLSFFTVLIGFILALLITLMRLSKNKLIRGLGTAYVEFVRGTPVLVQLMFVMYVVFGMLITPPKVVLFGFIETERFVPGVVALSLNSAAYVSEILRAGITAIDFGQSEAARSLGMTRTQTLKFIVLPQAIRNILPAIGNEFVSVIKETSVCSALGMQEIMYNADIIQSKTWLIAEPLIVAAVLYFIITFSMSKLMAYLERRMSSGYKR